VDLTWNVQPFLGFGVGWGVKSLWRPSTTSVSGSLLREWLFYFPKWQFWVVRTRQVCWHSGTMCDTSSSSKHASLSDGRDSEETQCSGHPFLQRSSLWLEATRCTGITLSGGGHPCLIVRSQTVSLYTFRRHSQECLPLWGRIKS
jgi:hypothetical protein